ncbi:MAG: adenylate/guanylate cyclase domain-containing protein [Candidatus Nitrosocosmicus sp.]
MNNDKIERAIGDGWYFFIDIIGASNPILSITCQLEKIIKLIDIIESFLNIHHNPEIYKSFTGDGMLIVFLDYKFAIELSIEIHAKLNEYNTSVEKGEKIFIRIGIGSGSFLSFRDGVHKEFAPWGHELVISKRIMDLARPNQILLTDFAFQKIKNDFLFDKNDYCRHLFDKGKIALKNHDELDNVYSLYKENQYGNNLDIEVNLDLKPLIQSHKIDKNFIDPMQNFCEERFEIILKKFQELTNPSKGLEMGLVSTGLIYKVLFENGSDYISATYLSPSQYWEIQNSEPVNLLSYHEKSLKRKNPSNSPKKNYRFLIIEKEKLDKDIRANQDSSLLFIKWHSENDVNLFHIEPNAINDVLNKYPKIVHNVGIGLWYDRYVLQFGPIMEYTNTKDHYHPLKRRRFWLHSFDSDTYSQSIQFFYGLIKSAVNGSIERIDHNFYNKIIYF